MTRRVAARIYPGDGEFDSFRPPLWEGEADWHGARFVGHPRYTPRYTIIGELQLPDGYWCLALELDPGDWYAVAWWQTVSTGEGQLN